MLNYILTYNLHKTHIWKQYSFRLAEPGRKDIDDRIKEPSFWYSISAALEVSCFFQALGLTKMLKTFLARV